MPPDDAEGVRPLIRLHYFNMQKLTRTGKGSERKVIPACGHGRGSLEIRRLVWRLTNIIALMGLAAFLGCADRRGHPLYPDAFLNAAREFRSKTPRDRFREAQDLVRQLPTCPVLYATNTGIGSIVSRDYEHPTFVLGRSEVIRLLGNPQYTRSEEFTYMVASGGKYTFDWVVGVHLNGDYVVSSTLFSNDRGAGPGK